MHRLSLVFVLFTLAAGAALAAEDGFQPFPVDWRAAGQSPVDLSFLLDAPAGKQGVLRAGAGHLVRPDGRRVRLWGVNVSAAACTPPKPDASQIAAHLARLGVSCVRFHFFDQPAPRGILDPSRNDTRALDSGQMDRLDWFVAELKRRGIYTNLNLNVARRCKPGDGVRDHELLGFAKGLTCFDPRLLELQREYARQLLTHLNPYTKSEYRREPAVAMVEIVNENSLVESWFSGRLLGQNTRKNPGTWTDIPASYEQDLTRRYNDWLRERLPAGELASLRKEAGVSAEGAIARLKPSEFAQASRRRFHTEAAFYMETEHAYFRDMGRYLREQVGVQQPILGTSDHNHGKSGYALLSATAQLDVVDGHVYWQHPQYLSDSAGGRRAGFKIPNTPMVDEPLRSTVVQLSRSAVAGKPYTVSEVNHPFPHEYACEGIPILAAYAALHDWDGVFWYTLQHESEMAGPERMLGHFDLAPDPVKMSQLAAGALVFARGDVRSARKTLTRSYAQEQVIEGIRMPWKEAPYFTPGFPLAAALTHATRIASLSGPATAQLELAAKEPIASDTGQLRWFRPGARQGVVTVDSARSQAIIGFSKANAQQTSHLALDLKTPFCAVTLGAMDDRPIAQSGKLLMTAGARVAHTAMRWNDRRTTLEDWGAAPVQIEPVTGTAVLRNLAEAVRVEAQPLSGAGMPLGKPLPLEKTPAGWRLTLGAPPTTWCVISVYR